MARAPWNRPGESPATRRLRIFIFFTAIACGLGGLIGVVFVVNFMLSNIS